MPPFSRISAYSLSICSFTHSNPRSRTTNLKRALLRFLRLPYSLNTRRTASIRFTRRSSGRNSSRSRASVGLGPLPTEARLLDEFLPEERLVNRIEAVLRVFNEYGNRKNRNKARFKFVVRERGFEWVKEQ